MFMLKGYLSVLTAEMKKSWLYRSAAFASIPLFFFRGLLSIAIVFAFTRTNSDNPQQLVNYFWLINLFYPIISAWVVDYDLNTMIKSGNIAYEYIKPLDIYSSWFMRLIGQRLAQLALSSLPILVVICFLPAPFSFTVSFSFEKIINANVNPQNISGKINLFIFKTKKLFLNKNITSISLCWTDIINVKLKKNKV